MTIPLGEVSDQCRQRFWRCVDLGPECWPWLGRLESQSRPSGDYGRFRLGRRWVRAHRVAYALARGAVPTEMHVHHTCANPRCVRPSHLLVLCAGEHTRLHAGVRTHCLNGHAFTPENTYHFVQRSGGPGRACRACWSLRHERDRREAAR